MARLDQRVRVLRRLQGEPMRVDQGPELAGFNQRGGLAQNAPVVRPALPGPAR